MTLRIQPAIRILKNIFFKEEGLSKPSFLFLFLFFPVFVNAEKNWNLILISIDTLRYDYLSIINPENAETPNLDDFSKNSIFFEYAFTTSPLTAPAHASVLTGVYPKDHSIRENLSGKLKPNIETISGTLKDKGFKTYGFVSSATLSRDYGFSNGFDLYDDGFVPCGPDKKCFVSIRKGEETIKKTLQNVNWNEKFFLFLHIFEPHFPYEPPEPYKSKYKKNLYAGEVEYSDFIIGEFLNFIKKRGLFKNTVICIFSDHGEGLNEHNEATHGYLTYNSTLRVPLMLYFPGCKPEKISYPVSLIDLYPTFLEILGIKKQEDLPGINLLNPKDRDIFFEALYPYFYFGTTQVIGFIKSPYKFIYKKNSELYNIYDDPYEKSKINQKKIMKKFKEILDKNYGFILNPIQNIEKEREKELKSLGYLGGADLKKLEGKDPDEVMGTLSKLEEARTEYLKRNLNQSLNLYKNLLKEFPKSSVLLDEIGLIFYSLGKKEEAENSFKLSLKYFPQNFNALINLANYFSQENKFKDAVFYYEKAMALKPNDPDLLFNYGATCANLGYIKKAKELFEKYIKLYPDDPEKKKIEEFLRKE